MLQTEKPEHWFETFDDVFSKRFSFLLDEGVTKDVEVKRRGRDITIHIEVADRAVIDATRETFKADGPVRISITDSGLYMTTFCALLAGRVSLRRTRFF